MSRRCTRTPISRMTWSAALSRLMINAHLRRYACPESLRRTARTPHSSGLRVPCIWTFLISLLRLQSYGFRPRDALPVGVIWAFERVFPLPTESYLISVGVASSHDDHGTLPILPANDPTFR